MPRSPARGDDLAHIIIGVWFGVDDRPRGSLLHEEHLVPADGARIDRPVDRVMVAGAMLVKRHGCRLEVLHF